MGNLSYENQGTNTFLVYQLEQEDIIDTMTIGMITNNKIYGLLPFIYLQKDDKKIFRYNTSSKTNLKQYFSGVVNSKRLLCAFSSLAMAIISAEEYMIEPNAFILDMEYIYINVSTVEVSLVCLPILKKSEDYADMRKFFKDIVFSVQFDQTENCDYVAKLISFLNSNISFSLNKFKNVVDSLIGCTNFQTTIQEKSVIMEPVAQMSKVQQIVKNDSVEEKVIEINYTSSENMQVSQKKLEDINIPGKAVDELSNIPGVPKGHKEVKKKKRGLFDWIKRKKNTSDKTSNNISQVVPVNPPVFSLDEKKTNTIKKKPNTVQENFGETTVLTVFGGGETTVLGVSQQGIVQKPYIVRKKNNQKMIIEKNIFRIGKEKSYVDFFIGDNTAISRSHADIITKDNEYFIIDNNSTNNTYIDGVMIPKQREIKIEHGAKLRLANEEFEFRLF